MAEALEPLKGFLHRVRGAVSRPRTGEHGGLRIVKAPENAEIDIVAVHGLGGEGFRSWITLDGKAGKPRSWLEELLGKDVPNARIMTYGYVSDSVNYRYLVRNVLYGRALDLVREFGAQRRRDGTERRPVFFIAHSLGGWIVKRALIISSEAADPLLKDIGLSTCGVAFFGTLSPGGPSSRSPLANVISRTTSGLADDGRRNSASSMKPQAVDIDWLENQMEAFKAITAYLPKLSFHETKQSHDGFVVAKRHSMVGSDGSQIPLASTHSDLIKFRGRDANYKTFLAKFREMLDKTKTHGLLEAKQKEYDLAAVHRPGYINSNFSIPYNLPGEPYVVVPRLDLVDGLDAILNPPPDDPETVHLKIATLWGLPGTGKTALATYYARLRQHEISFVFWIWAESWETVVTSYLQFANALVLYYSKDVSRSHVENDLGLIGIDDMLKVKRITDLDALRIKSVIQAVKDWLLRPENDKWLLVFDNVEPSYNIFDFIPLTLSGKIVLTSRDVNCCSWGTKLHVDAMTEEQAVKQMETLMGFQSLEDPVQATAAAKIAQQLSYHPRSISLAISTLRKQELTIAEYQEKLEAKTALRFIGSAIDQSPYTGTILRISAMLSTSVIPVAIFTTSHLKEAPSRFMNIFAEMKIFQNSGHLDDVLQHLLDQNFIQTPDSSPVSSPTSPTSSQSSSSSSFDSFILDPDARDHVRSTLTADEQVEHAWLACNVIVDGIRNKESTSLTLPEMHDFGRIIAPHAKVCYDDWSDVLETLPDSDDVAWHVLGNVCMTQGAIEQAIGCFELSLKLKGTMDPMEKIQTSLSLASLLQRTGQSKRSSDILAGIDIGSIGKAVRFRVSMARASASAAQGELDQAEGQFESLEHEQEETLGPTDISTVGTVQQLASTLEQLCKLEEAQALYRRVYLSYQNIFGLSHPITLEALENLAHVSMASNAIDEAESLYKQSVDIKTRSLGAGHPSTAEAIQRLAVIDDIRCRYPEAQIKYRQALDIMAPTLGKAHPQYTTTMENMALSSRWHGRVLSDSVGAEDPASRRGRAAAAFEQAELLYLDVLAVKKSARELYSEPDLLEAGSKLREMYENEAFFTPDREGKVAALRALLRDGRARGSTTTASSPTDDGK